MHDDAGLAMARELFVLGFDATPDPWFLTDPVPGIDSDEFRRGERVEVPENLRIAIDDPGQPLDITMRGGPTVVVTERVGAVIEGLAGEDVQRIPVHVDGVDGRYELLHVLARIDAVDRKRTKAYAFRPGATVGESGTVASLAPLIGDDGLYSYVMRRNMVLSTAGIEGARIFRVPRWHLWPVVTAEIKDALEQIGATGVRYTPLLTSP